MTIINYTCRTISDIDSLEDEKLVIQKVCHTDTTIIIISIIIQIITITT